MGVYFDYRSCSGQANVMRVDYAWGPIMGCMIEVHPGQWIPIDKLRSNDVTVR
jgi:hypothetical protein